MDSKRLSQHEGDESVQIRAQHSKRRREDSQQADSSIIGFGKLRSLLHINTDIAPHMTNFFRTVVREELELKLVSRPTINQIGPYGAKFFKLVFMNDLPATIFTHSNIKAKDGRPVEIALYDIRSQSIVTDRPSIKIMICVLKGEFGSNGSEDWNTNEFKANISRERENKGKLLKGDTVITLENGVGHITKIMFTDNSKCTRSRHFRLGAIVLSTSDEANIKEAVSNRFMVKDSRGELNQKHYPPLLNDEVYRLKNISKDGKVHQRLSKLGINTVKDLLQRYETNPSLLEEVLRKTFGKNSTKLREAIQHAKTCNPEVTSDGQNYRSQDTLKSDEKRLEIIQQHAYRNVKDFIPVVETSAHSFPSPLASPQIAGQCREALELPAAQQDQLEKRQDFNQLSTSTSHIGKAAYKNQVGFEEMLPGMCMEGIDLSLFGSHVQTEVPDVYSTEKNFSEAQFVNDIYFPKWE